MERREVLHGQVWMTHPVTVIDDTAGVLAVVVSPGSPFTFPDHPFGPHPWAGYQQWSDTTALHLHRDGDPYSVWKMFRGGVFDHWYLNPQAPIIAHPDGTGGGSVDTADHGLDILVPADGSPWQWKDLHDPDQMAPTGRITPTEAAQIHTHGQALTQLLATNTRWWSTWDTWNPGDPAGQAATPR